MFDQPDMKNEWVLTTVTPNDWICISNEKESSRSEDKDKNTITFEFEKSPKLSTYLYCLCAGPF